MQADQFDLIVNAIVKELSAVKPVDTIASPSTVTSSVPSSQAAESATPKPEVSNSPAPAVASTQPAQSEKSSTTSTHGDLVVDLPDPTTLEARSIPGIPNPADPDGLRAIMEATPSRIGYGRCGPRYRTPHWLLFQADQAITQDTLYRDVDDGLLNKMGLFKVQTEITGGKQEYLLRPDLGRRLSEAARATIQQKCTPKPTVQISVGDGLSSQAIEANLAQIMPVIQQGCQTAGFSMGTPFFIQYCRVGVMNDIGDILQPEILMLLIGERPGLGRADSMSIYMAYKPHSGHTDAERDVICNVFNGGTNPLEAGAYAVQLAKKMIQYQAAGVKLKLAEK